MDPIALKQSWARVARHGDAVPAYFYAALFTAYPELRTMFPVSMSAQRDRLVAALGKMVSRVDELESVVPFVQGLGRDHRRFDVKPDHYPQVGEALLATLAHFLDEDWTPELAADWTAAYGVISSVMVEAAAHDASPPYWSAKVLEHDRRGFDTAVLQLEPASTLPYQAGQACAVEIPARPRLWRYYSIASAPKPGRPLELHVKAVPGGQVSSAIVHGLQPDDVVKLGAPVGQSLTLDGAGPELLFLAGGTGLAPLKSLIQQIADLDVSYTVTLLVGARTQDDLYDLPAMLALAEQHSWLTVIPVVSDDPWFRGERGLVVDVAIRLAGWKERDVFVCGSIEMVSGTRERLLAAGLSENRLRTEDGTGDPYRPAQVESAALEGMATV